MLIAMIKSGKGVMHFAGELDAYNMDLLRDHAARVLGEAKDRPDDDAELRISVEPREEEALRDCVDEWLGRLAQTGVRIRVQSRQRPEVSLLPRRQPGQPA